MGTTREEEINIALNYLIDYVNTPSVRSLLGEFWGLPKGERAQFVLDVLLNVDALRERDVVVPPDIIFQRSAFGDNRPTLFCMTKYLPDGIGWKKVTITFDNPDGEPALRYDDIDHRTQDLSAPTFATTADVSSGGRR
ncbi:MAG: hypothetical protein ACRDYA_17405 [Egibacteraceae bacterium]